MVLLEKILSLAFAIQSAKLSAHLLKSKSVCNKCQVCDADRKYCRSKKVKLMGIWVIIVTKSSWEKWNLSYGLKDVGYLQEQRVWWAGDYQKQGAWSLWVNVGPSFGFTDWLLWAIWPPSTVRAEGAGSAQLSQIWAEDYATWRSSFLEVKGPRGLFSKSSLYLFPLLLLHAVRPEKRFSISLS